MSFQSSCYTRNKNYVVRNRSWLVKWGRRDSYCVLNKQPSQALRNVNYAVIKAGHRYKRPTQLSAPQSTLSTCLWILLFFGSLLPGIGQSWPWSGRSSFGLNCLDFVLWLDVFDILIVDHLSPGSWLIYIRLEIKLLLIYLVVCLNWGDWKRVCQGLGLILDIKFQSQFEPLPLNSTSKSRHLRTLQLWSTPENLPLKSTPKNLHQITIEYSPLTLVPLSGKNLGKRYWISPHTWHSTTGYPNPLLI